MSDGVIQALAQDLPPGVPNSYRARADRSGVPHTTIYARDHGRPSMKQKAERQQYLAPWEEDAVVKYLLQMSDLGQPVRIKYIPQIAFSVTRQRPPTDRPPKPPGKNWAKGLENRHPELKAKRVKALDWNRHEKNIYEKITRWFKVIEKVLKLPDVLPKNVHNMDETGVMLSMPCSAKVLVGKDDMRDYRGARVKRTTVTAIECVSADGRFLNPMIIWPASTHRSNWTTYPTPGWQYACSESGYTDSKISLEWLKRIFDPETKERANGKPRVLICDGFGTHETLEVLEYCFENNIILCRLPSHTSHKLQPCDVAVFAPLKAAYRDEVDRLERAGTNTIGKEHFTSLYSHARARAFTKKNILAGWAKCGLGPFDPNRVLKDIPKPPAELTISKADEVMARSCPQDDILQTPVTPVSAEALMSLQSFIIKKHALDETSKRDLARHLQKLTKAGQTSFAKSALQQHQIRFLIKMNDESKVRRSTKSDVLGKAKVMSYEDLVEARAKRAEKEAAKEAKGKGKRGRPKNAAPGEEEASEKSAKRTRKRKRAATEPGTPESAEAKVARMSEASQPSMGMIAPVAQMMPQWPS